MKLENFSTSLIATTITAADGKFHPALLWQAHYVADRLHVVHYWENRKFDDEDEAYVAASAALDDAIAAANAVIEQWNLTKL